MSPGWRFQRDKFTLSIFAGLDIQHHKLSPDDPGNALRGTKTGIRAGIDAWYEPDPRTMLNAESPPFGPGPFMLVWTDPVDAGAKLNEQFGRRGSALVSLPIKLQSPPSGSRFQVPATFVPAEAYAGSRG